MNQLHLYRKRYIPDQINDLKDDKILYASDNCLVTEWNTIHPRKDIARGVSLYVLEFGWKISHMFDAEGNPVYWYIDIIETERKEEENALIYHDLLLDVVIYPDGDTRLLDLDELADALEKRLIPEDYALKAMRRSYALLKAIRNDEIKRYLDVLSAFE